MKTFYKTLLITVFITAVSSCKKYDEISPRTNNIIREYILPEPAFLNNAEREEVNKQRNEYNSL